MMLKINKGKSNNKKNERRAWWHAPVIPAMAET
jgi:hypothetical protein